MEGARPREHPKKIETHYLFLQPLKLATEKNGTQHEFRFTLPNTSFK